MGQSPWKKFEIKIWFSTLKIHNEKGWSEQITGSAATSDWHVQGHSKIVSRLKYLLVT